MANVFNFSIVLLVPEWNRHSNCNSMRLNFLVHFGQTYVICMVNRYSRQKRIECWNSYPECGKMSHRCHWNCVNAECWALFAAWSRSSNKNNSYRRTLKVLSSFWRMFFYFSFLFRFSKMIHEKITLMHSNHQNIINCVEIDSICCQRNCG